MVPLSSTMMRIPLAALLFGWPLISAPLYSAPAASCSRCGWSPPRTRFTQTVRPGSDLIRIIRLAQPDTSILLEDGVYSLDGTLQILTPGVVLRGKSGDRSRVSLRGLAIGEQRVRIAVSIEAPRATLADLSIGLVGWHGIQV